MHILFNALFLAAGVKWGAWRRWREFYPTILYFISVDLLKNYLLYNHLMWTYQETFFAKSLLQNHTFINLMIMAIVYPSTVLIYLGRFPDERWKQILWLALWIFVYWIVEFINLKFLNLINHHHGWNMGWSLLFLMVMFPMLRIHHKNPLLAWFLSVIFILFLWNVFDVPIEIMK
ncbi:CBO0543 family protein [Bacillus sp. FJAT-29814]|uniref:CBO0543 family protein n=1 Tax=Bacillus sp. FJAT-29814 TaxID=1729688 RepID=UPI00083028D7|nr:CBO0543 family protein [Bacillus sp. FJAT-29814]